MGLYKAFFYEVYTALYAVKGYAITDTADSVAFSATLMMTLLPMLNLITFDLVPEPPVSGLLIVAGALEVFNYLLFVSKDRFWTVVREYRSKPNRARRLIVLMYVLLTLVLLFAHAGGWSFRMSG